jgi:hypothetical protein
MICKCHHKWFTATIFIKQGDPLVFPPVPAGLPYILHFSQHRHNYSAGKSTAGATVVGDIQQGVIREEREPDLP